MSNDHPTTGAESRREKRPLTLGGKLFIFCTVTTVLLALVALSCFILLLRIGTATSGSTEAAAQARKAARDSAAAAQQGLANQAVLIASQNYLIECTTAAADPSQVHKCYADGQARTAQAVAGIQKSIDCSGYYFNRPRGPWVGPCRATVDRLDAMGRGEDPFGPVLTPPPG